MITMPIEESSYWQNSVKTTSYSALNGDITVDAAIVGGGIAGLTTAYLLKKAGLKVAVLEKNTLGSGTTSKTTGKVTSQHNLIYENLDRRLGRKITAVYANANQTAVEKIIQLIRRENIDCDLTIDDNYVFTADVDKVAQFKAEAKIAIQLGLPATFETKLALPFEIQAAVKFAGQAKFNIQKYILALAVLIDGDGSFVFENSEAINFQDGEPAQVKTKKGMITAKDIIIATKIPSAPLVARGAYAALEHPHTSYIVAGKVKDPIRGMYISPDKQHYSLLPVSSGNDQLLLIGGEKHTPGLGNPHRRYQRLAHYGEKHFGISSIVYRWKGMDYMAYDDVPLIGKVYPWSKHLYTATGFKKWGLSTSMVAAMILRDTILGQENPWASTFSSMRLKPVISIPHAIIKGLAGQ